MCKGLCTRSKDMIKKADWQTMRIKKPTKYHYIIFATVLIVLAVYMIKETNKSGIEYNGSKTISEAAIEISGVDFVSNEFQKRYQSLASSMKNRCGGVSEDVMFAFQFNANERSLDDHVFTVCDTYKVFGNAKIIQKSEQKIKCTEEYNGELKMVVRPKEVLVRAIDMEEWKVIEYSSKNPKESCMLQHGIEILELNW